MKIYSRLILVFSFLIIVFCLLPSFVLAQAGPGGDPDVTVPVDGGLSFLAGAGIAYGAKKLKEYKKRNKNNITEDVLKD